MRDSTRRRVWSRMGVTWLRSWPAGRRGPSPRSVCRDSSRGRCRAPHGDHDVGSFDGLRGQDLGSFGGNVDPFFGHGLDGDGIDLVGGFGTGRAYLDLAAGQLT